MTDRHDGKALDTPDERPPNRAKPTALRSSASPPEIPAEGAREAELSKEPNRCLRALKVLGPGLITGASDDDPSGIGTYSTAGASVGFALLWSAFFTFPLMAAVQYICAKIGLETGSGLAGVLRRHYPRWLLYPVVIGLLVANTFNVGADIGAIAAAVSLLVPVQSAILIVPIAAIIVALVTLASYRVLARLFKWLTLSLFAYVAASFFAHPSFAQVARGTLVPTISLDSGFLAVFVAILGTTISPYLFFWQTGQEVEARVDMGLRRLWQRQGTTDAELRYAFWDVSVGMLFSNLVMYFIILATGATLFAAGKHDIQSATDAAAALRPIAGAGATILFAVGLIGTGLLAVPALAGSSAYAVSEAMGWQWGLDETPFRAKQFYGVIAVSTLVGMAINFVGINPITALFWSAVVNGFLAPPLLVLVMLIVNNRKIMRGRVNSRITNILGWVTTAVMFLAAIGLIATSIPGG